jgi:hypothetical protein
MRNADLEPDWLRIGTDIIGGTPYDVQYDLLPDWRDRSSGRDADATRNANAYGNAHRLTERRRWRRLQYRYGPVGKPPNPLAPAGAGRRVVVDPPAAPLRCGDGTKKVAPEC